MLSLQARGHLRGHAHSTCPPPDSSAASSGRHREQLSERQPSGAAGQRPQMKSDIAAGPGMPPLTCRARRAVGLPAPCALQPCKSSSSSLGEVCGPGNRNVTSSHQPVRHLWGAVLAKHELWCGAPWGPVPIPRCSLGICRTGAVPDIDGRRALAVEWQLQASISGCRHHPHEQGPCPSLRLPPRRGTAVSWVPVGV